MATVFWLVLGLIIVAVLIYLLAYDVRGQATGLTPPPAVREPKVSHDPFRARISSGRWQIALGALLEVAGVLAFLAASSVPEVIWLANVFLAIGSGLLFWGAMMTCFSVIEARVISIQRHLFHNHTEERDG